MGGYVTDVELQNTESQPSHTAATATACVIVSVATCMYVYWYIAMYCACTHTNQVYYMKGIKMYHFTYSVVLTLSIV